MDITRNVVLDLLPMYLAKEVSADTRILIEKYLETDQELANIVKHSEEMGLPGDIPVPLTRDDNLKTYKKAKKTMLLRSILLAIAIMFLVGLISYMFFVSP